LNGLSGNSLVLALDASSPVCSIALAQGSQPIAEKEWPSSRGNSGALVHELASLCRASDACWDDIDLVLIGCGPGQYAGLRASVTAAQAIQLPAKGRIAGMSSAHALLAEIRAKYPDTGDIMICGDARRDHVWLYHWQRNKPEIIPEMQCLHLEAIQALPVCAGTCVLSPDYDRLNNRLPIPTTATWISDNQYPKALQLIRGAQRHPVCMGAPDILYVHPPVFVTPRTDSRG
jgi:tRNA threonylcarbamoyl adenosine modification protein YeaZ